MSRVYDIELECGCMISLDGGGGLIPCHYGYGCGKKGCDVNHQCKECLDQEKKCMEVWKKYKKSEAYKKHEEEIVRRNE